MLFDDGEFYGGTPENVATGVNEVKKPVKESRQVDSWDRVVDQATRKFFEDRNIALTPESMRRLLLLNKRRKEFYQGRTTIFGGETSSTHLEDVLDIIKNVPEEIKVAASIHDIGKTGPWREEEEDKDNLDEIIMSLFAAVHNFNIKKNTVMDLLRYISQNDGSDFEKAAEILRKNGIDPNIKLNDFYPMHVQWGRSVLEHEPSISARDKFIALNHHHTLRGITIPVDSYEPTDEDVEWSTYLEVVDFYVASKNRASDKTNEKPKTKIRKVFSGKISTEKLEKILATLPD